jgi:hypothetical protein
VVAIDVELFLWELTRCRGTDIGEETSNSLERTNAILNTIDVILIVGTVANFGPWPPGQKKNLPALNV